jgi:signal transduction histidine kinase
MAQLRPLAAKKGLALHVRLSNAVHAWGDRRRVYQILLNLAGNAVKFTEQGSVTIAARCVDDRLEVEVHDTGIGIAAAHIDSLFEPFHQIDGSLARAHEGTGLGLYLSKKLLALMGGTIGVTSRRGHGSCFRFTLPVALPTDSQLAALTALP